MPEFKNKEEYEKWKNEKAMCNAEKLQKQQMVKDIEVVCRKCGSKNIYNPENKKENCDRCGEWLFQFITTSVPAPEKARTIKSGLFSLFFCIVAACATFVPLLTVGLFKYYLWNGFSGAFIGLLFVFYGFILASIVFSLLTIYLNKKQFKASLVVVCIILVVLTIISYNKASTEFLRSLAEAKAGLSSEEPLGEDRIVLYSALEGEYESEGIKKGLGFWIIIFSNISTALVTGRELLKKEGKK